MSKKSSEIIILEEISSKLDNLIKISALCTMKDKTMTDQVGLLAEFGFKNPEIAQIVGTNVNSVATMKNQYKKRIEK